MKRLRAFAALMLAVIFGVQLIIIPAAGADSGFSYQLDKQNASGEDIVALQIKIDESTAVAGFRARVAYDDSVLQFVSTETSSSIENGTLQTNSESNPIYAVYVCNTGKGYAPKLSGTILTFLFRVKEDAPAGATDVSACMDEVCDYSGNYLDMDSFSTLPLSIMRKEPEQAQLTGLEPSQGALNPAFSPDVYDYRLNVDSSVHSVTFNANATEGASVKVSRKSLNQAGTDTPILVTVTSADGKEQTQYLITVSRAASPQNDENDSPAPESKSTLQSSGKTKKHRNVSEAAEEALQAAKNGKSQSSTRKQAEASSQTLSGEATVQNIPVTAENHAQSASGLTVIQDRMPAYFVGMLAAGFCMIIGIALCLWFSIKKK